MTDKVIITNQTALTDLYGKRTNEVISSLEQLVEADKKRHLISRIVFIDSAEEMKKYDAPPVSDKTNEKQNKDAVDAVYKTLTPDYILLLGGPDIIPHQSLENPMKETLDKAWPDKGPDKFRITDFPADVYIIPTDLPYASNSPYSTSVDTFIKDFQSETNHENCRLLGRLPGITGDSNPDCLLTAIKTAIETLPKPRKIYQKYLAIQTPEPITSYGEDVLTEIYYNDDKLLMSPPEAYDDLEPEEINSLVHIWLCHGTPNMPYFYGEGKDGKKSYYKVALAPSAIKNKIKSGTIATALCCYGGQLYDPKQKRSDKYLDFLKKIGWAVCEPNEPALCNTYLNNGAVAYVGSTNFAMDPSIVMYFADEALQGKTLGEAFNQARHLFLQNNPEHMIMEYVSTTFAEFIFLGDPSLQVVESKEEKTVKQLEYITHPATHRKLLLKNRLKQSAIKTNAIISKSANWIDVPEVKLSAKSEQYIDRIKKQYNLFDYHIKQYQKENSNEITYQISGVEHKNEIHVHPNIITIIFKETNGEILHEKTLCTH